VKIFHSSDLSLVADIPASAVDEGRNSKVVGLVDAPGNRFVFSLFDTHEIWIAELRDGQWTTRQFKDIGLNPYDALLTPDGRHYIAGLFGEDGMALLDLWQPDRGVRRILPDYGMGEQRLPIYKMPHLEGWAVAGNRAYVPAVGRHEVIVIDTNDWQEIGRIPVLGQPIFVMARPGGRQVWVNFALPDNSHIQIIDTLKDQVVQQLSPGKGVLHMEFLPRGEAVWLSVRDDNQLQIYDTETFERLSSLPAEVPSGIFFTARAHRLGL
jgi:protein NirF